MSIIISNTGVILPAAPWTIINPEPVQGQLFYQIGVGPRIWGNPIPNPPGPDIPAQWYSVDETSVDFLTLLGISQNNVTSNAALGSIASAISSHPSIDFTPLIQALNTDSANLIQSTNGIAEFVKALAVITEYWKQISEVNVERATNGTYSLPNDEPLIPDQPIIAAHTAAQNAIQ